MAVRPSMSYIITFVRDLINDDAGASQQFTDQQIQDRLDLTMLAVYGEDLMPADTVTSTGFIEWHDWYAKYPFWETDFLVQQINGTTATPDVSEPLTGKFHYTANQTHPVMITGSVYNVYGTASQLLISWVASLRSQVTSWTADGTTVQRTGQIKTMMDLSKTYASMGWGWGASTQIKLVRRDLRN